MGSSGNAGGATAGKVVLADNHDLSAEPLRRLGFKRDTVLAYLSQTLALAS